MGTLLLTVLVASFGIIALVFIMFLISARADHQNTISGPMATLAELDNSIDTKKAVIVDLEEDLSKRREALANIATMQAEVDALVRQRDEVLAEYAQLSERKEEILSMREETEEAFTKLSEVTRDLSDKSAELDLIQARLDKAERLVADIQRMTEQHTLLEAKMAALREERSHLQAAQIREKELRIQIETLERDTARLLGEMDTFQSRKDEAVVQAQASQARLAALEASHTEAAVGLEAAYSETRQAQSALTRMEDQRVNLEAQIAQLKASIGGLPGTPGAPESDPLAELKVLPPVLTELRSRKERDQETEAEALHRVTKHMEALGLEYPRRVIHAFHTAMKVNETTQMAVLAGISGTGKSQLPRRYAEAMGFGFLQVPVQPRWDSPQDLMGFYNYIENKFRPTDMARALYHLDAVNGPEESHDLQDRMMLVLLDEMNLARVEYYFSDFLSRLESRPGMGKANTPSARKDAEIELDIPMSKGQTTPRVFPGYNVLFAGTMNEDESTQSLSDKVVDRANVLRFAAPKTIKAGVGRGTPEEVRALSRKRWQAWVQEISSLGVEQDRVETEVEKMAGHMRGLHRPIGHRLGRAIMAYTANYPEENGRQDIKAALADQVEMRLLPKLRGVEIENAENELNELVAYIEGDLQDATLAKALRESIEMAQNGTGQFVWRGVARE